MTEPVFTGVGVALATLFDADLAVDVDATRDHAVRLVEAGMQAVIVAGAPAKRRPWTATSAGPSSPR